jgi:hypothetical protein
MEQRWFAGAHSDVGGGYADNRLANLSLRWMQDKAVALGLAVEGTEVGAEDYKGTLTDSYANFLGGRYAEFRARILRDVGVTRYGNETIDPSVELRRRAEPLAYLPLNRGLPELL